MDTFIETYITNTSTPDNNVSAPLRLVRTLLPLLTAQRALAYASEVGESLRPIFTKTQTSKVQGGLSSFINRNIVKGFYGLSWLYVIVDTTSHGLVHHDLHNDGIKTGVKVADTFLFHAFASMYIPATVIHTTVRGSSSVLNYVTSKIDPKVSNTQLLKLSMLRAVRAYGPTAIGLGLIPFIITPIDHGVHFIMDKSLRPYYESHVHPYIRKFLRR
jgi:fission process protein 1